MDVARLALDYLNAFLTPAPLAAGIVLFLLLKYQQAIGNLFQLLANQSEFRRAHDSAIHINYLGEQFVRVRVLYEKLLADSIITPEQHRAWTAFDTHFRIAYQQVVDLWKNAAEAAGRSVGETARAETIALAKVLSDFEATAYRALGRRLTPAQPQAKALDPPS